MSSIVARLALWRLWVFSDLTNDSESHDCAVKLYGYVFQLNFSLYVYEAAPHRLSNAGIVIGDTEMNILLM